MTRTPHLALMLAVAVGATASGSRVAASGGQPPASQQPGAGDIAPEALAQIEALVREKETRSPVERKIDSQLLYARRMQQGLPIAPGVQTLRVDLPYADDGHVIVDVKARVTTSLLARVNGLSREVVSRSSGDLRLHVDLDQIEAIAAQPDVVFVQPRQEFRTSRAGAPQMSSALGTGQGAVTSQGDITHRAAVFRGLAGFNGAGVKIGVLSDGVDHLALAQASGDLGPVTVLPGQGGLGDEGTAMLEIIHDLAPGAQLYFASAIDGISAFARNIRDLRAAGCDIIVDDVQYFVETPFQDGQAPGVISTTNGGVVIQAVKDVTADGALYFSAAGNEGNLSDGTSGVWEGDFVEGPNIEIGSLHLFAPGQAFTFQTVAGFGVVNLFWSDPLGASANDYDLFALDSKGRFVGAASTNFQTGTQDPYERMNYPPESARLVVLKGTGAAGRFLHLNTWGGQLSIATAGQTHGHNSTSSPFSFGVAATPAAGPYPGTFSTSDVVETFSSDGPRRIMFTENGTPITPGNVSSTGGQVLQKPDLTAADGVVVSGAGSFPGTFFGTSAAAPHAAAIAALFKSQHPSWTQAQLRSALLDSALDIEAAGVDRDSGAGIVMAAALQPACTFTLGPSTASVGIAGGTTSATVTASAGDCTWAAWSTVGWITVSGGGVGTGSGPLDYTVAANGGLARVGTIVIQGGQTITVSQAGGAAISFDNTTPLSIPAFATTESSIVVKDLTGPITNVSVSLHVTHTWDSDLTFRLIGPDDTVIELSVQNGGSGDDYGTSCTPLNARTTFDDAAATRITHASAPFVGTFRPEQALSVFNGKSGGAVNGTWKLSLYDSFRDDQGTLVCWSLHITAAPPVATPPTGFGIYPQSQPLPPGSTATMTVAGTGSVPISYQWYVGLAGDTSNPIFGATSSSYTTPMPPPLSNTTHYWVRVSNPFGTADTNTATVTVVTPGLMLVDTTADGADVAPGNGVCATRHGDCTLRAAIQEANALAGAQVITLPAGTYTLTNLGPLDFRVFTSDLEVSTGSVITINGDGAATTIIDANAIGRAFYVHGSLTLNDATVRNGYARFNGGCFYGDGQVTLNRAVVTDCHTPGDAGGILMDGSNSALTLTDTTVSNNTAVNDGGGVYTLFGTATTITRSTISGNSAKNGAGIEIYTFPTSSTYPTTPTTLTMTNSTITGNTATSYGGAIYFTGGSVVDGGGTATLTNVTIASNSSGVGGAVAVTSAGQPFEVRNTVIANSAGAASANCAGVDGGVITDLGNNLEFPGTTCGFSLPSDRRADPLLGPLASNGYVTQTHALGSGSPAIDAGDSPTCAAPPVSSLDQRGFVRPSACDMGAYEFGAAGIAPSITTPPQSQTIVGGLTATLTVAAAGTLPLTYQWYLGASGNTSSPIAGATLSRYTTPALSTPAAYWVRVSNPHGTADSATATIAISPPLTPASLIAIPAGFTRIRLRWTVPAGAASFTIKRGLAPGAETVLVTGVTGTTYRDTTAVRGQTYYYVVSAVNGGGPSADSAEVAGRTLTRLTPLDFDGDGKSDPTYVHPATFTWNSLESNAIFTTSTSVQWGLPGDVPVPGDYDGDGMIDPAVYRPSSGTWYALLSSTDQTTFLAASVGLSTDTPVPADYDGDGRTDPAIYRASTGTWFVLKSSTAATTPAQIPCGLPGDVPVAADYDGDGQADPAVYRPSSGTWFVLKSSTGLTTSETFALGTSTDLPVPYTSGGQARPAVYRPSSRTWLLFVPTVGYWPPVQWGLAGDLPVPADYDGDGATDFAVYRPSSGTWYERLSTIGLGRAQPWGQSDDVPLPIVSVPPRSDARRSSDVDADGKADLTVFRPSSGQWFTLTSSSNYTAALNTQWGLSTDTAVPGDYDGDGRADRAVFRPATGEWHVLTSSGNYTTSFSVQWGVSTDRPVPEDYDGDGWTDPAVYRPSTGTWFILPSSSGFTAGQGIHWGLSGDTPVANDYDGDGKTDPAVYRPSTGTWYVLMSGTDYTTQLMIQWGLDGDTPVPGDYDGDGKGDLAVYRPSTGQWFVLFSGAGFTTSQVVPWGLPDDFVVPLDYDGDGTTDFAVYRPATGVWYVLTSTSGYTTFFMRQWGLSTDVPILKR